MRFLRSRRGLGALAVLIVILFLFRPGVYRLRQRISGSIGSALGRKVSIEHVRVHILPRPGFDLEGMVISDDPAFSAEPMMRAQEVSAAIRFRSLFRGRLEIATLTATEPSINLVRNDEGRWNLASLIERNAHTPVAPTGNPNTARPALPYLEATNARINFKIGQAKKSWALTDAEVSLWQDGENSWGARIKAQPVRTDFNLTDTGVIQVNASWQRSANLGDTPLQVTLQWQNGQLGQITKLFSGRDHGWRGGLSLGAILSGTPNGLKVRSEMRIDQFRRYDIMSNGVLLAATCNGDYSAKKATMTELSCGSPAGGGSLLVRGSIGPMTMSGAPNYDLTFSATSVPFPSLLEFVRQTKKGLPADLTAIGKLDAQIRVVTAPNGGAEWSGTGTASAVHLISGGGSNELLLGNIPLSVRRDNVKHRNNIDSRSPNDEPSEAHLEIGPVPLAMGGAGPATASAWLSASGYRLALRGETEISNLYRLANTVGVSGFHPVAEGAARLDLSVSGIWQGFGAPQAVGYAQLRNVHTGMRGLNPRIDITSAVIKLDPETVTFDPIVAQTEDTQWSGSVKAPRHCPMEGCIFQFDLSADQLAANTFASWFTPRPAKRPWYRILDSSTVQGKSSLLLVRARGRLHVNRLTLNQVVASQIVTQVDLDAGKIMLTGLRGQIFEGTHQGDWVIDLSNLIPHFQASGTLQNVSMATVGKAMKGDWATGMAQAKFRLITAGNTFSDLLAHAEGELSFSLRNGTLPHLEIPDASKPFSIHSLSGLLEVKNGGWKLSNGKIESHDGIFQVSGTATPDKGLNMLLTRGEEQAWTITGSLVKPTTAVAVRAQARTVAKP